jgi:hypothetical protein
MSEVEALALLDLISHPLGKVFVIELALTFLIPVHNELVKIVVI